MCDKYQKVPATSTFWKLFEVVNHFKPFCPLSFVPCPLSLPSYMSMVSGSFVHGRPMSHPRF